MYYGKKHVEVGKSSFGRMLIFKDETGERKIWIGLSFEEATDLAKELTA